MATIAEMIETIKDSKHKKAILNHIIDYLDETLLTSDANKRRILLTDDRQAVPEESIEKFVTELSSQRSEHDEAINAVLGMQVIKGKVQ